ncbi:hypothetical protein [Streptomyces cupreus]|uniref:Uncharacterized protein n=1 Tax=Streptomyces cupreus TaxID=2759956 RepID=A0A7X1J9Q4_9ACTN|nr:hypothetical protein [Streptomyces cupreus]MBC2906764.1 hypothetical protein [Streptomyces cupreus]
MLKFIENIGARVVARVAPSVTADAAAEACWNEYSHCQTNRCSLPWQDRIAYDRICNGVYQYTWLASCGTCAA